jgi:phage N-6-adenine-methyltransferase
MGNKFQQATPTGPTGTMSDVWLTPQWVIDKIGISDLDPCGHLPDGKPIVITARNYFTEQDDGLIKDWYGSVFCNPPYSDLRVWLARCAKYHKDTGNDVIALVFVRSETKAYQENVKSATGINLINKRIKFLTGEGIEKTNGNAPSCLIAWGEGAYDRIKNVDGIYVRIDKN